MLSRSSVLAGVLCSLLLTAALLLSNGCQPTPINPPVNVRPTLVQATLEASLHARDMADGGGVWYRVDSSQHSMEPFLLEGDLLVVDTKVRLKDVVIGRIIVYSADWRPPGASPLCHRATERDRYGLIASGDNNRPSLDANGRDMATESRHRVTEERLIGVVIAVYRAAAPAR